MRIWRNRQTRQIQVLVVAIPCVFKSHYPHQRKTSQLHQLRGFFIALSHKIKCAKGQHCDTCTINSRYSITEQRLNIFILFYDFGTNLSSYPKESAILQTIFRDGLTALLSILDIICCVLY